MYMHACIDIQARRLIADSRGVSIMREKLRFEIERAPARAGLIQFNYYMEGREGDELICLAIFACRSIAGITMFEKPNTNERDREREGKGEKMVLWAGAAVVILLADASVGYRLLAAFFLQKSGKGKEMMILREVSNRMCARVRGFFFLRALRRDNF